ncbi:hypothetical protein BGX34_003429 [Mortierella sp. NVP85]|nr:hypothetical protein BGX34_003429 [Mortierella sp. NVP85]
MEETDSSRPQTLAHVASSWLKSHKAAQAARKDASKRNSVNSDIIHHNSTRNNNDATALSEHKEKELPPWVTLNLNAWSVPSASPSSPAPIPDQPSSAPTTEESAAAEGEAAGEATTTEVDTTASPDAITDVNPSPPEAESATVRLEYRLQRAQNRQPPTPSPYQQQIQDLELQLQQLELQPHEQPQLRQDLEQQLEELEEQELDRERLERHAMQTLSLQEPLPQRQASETSTPIKRSQSKYRQPWRRTHPEVPSRKPVPRRVLSTPELVPSAIAEEDADVAIDTEQPSTTSTSMMKRFDLPHDILLAIFSHLPPRANAQQYYTPSHPSDLVTCSRVNMAWRIAALSIMWHTILLPDPMDKSCRRLLHLLASSHASAQITGRNYDITEIIERVEVDLLDAAELLLEEKDPDATDDAAAGGAATTASSSTIAEMAAMPDNITTLLQFVSPFRTLSIQLPQEIESKAAEVLTRTASLPILEAVVQGIQDAKIQELDMPSPMYCSVPTFPGMLSLITHCRELRTLVLGYSSRDWPLLRAIISLPNLENLCVFDSCWSNQIWIYLLSSLGPRLRGLTVLQGRRPLEGVVLREGIAPHCRNLTSLSIPFIQLLQGPKPVLKDSDVVPVIKACCDLQSINLAGQTSLGNPVLEAMTELWGLQLLDIRDCNLMTGKSIKRVLWQSIQRVRLFGCGELTQEFMDLILQAWRGRTGLNHHMAARHFASVLDFGADVEDPVEMGWNAF